MTDKETESSPLLFPGVRENENKAEWEGTGGNSIEYYDGRWLESFDLVFLVGMGVGLIALVLLTVFFYPELFEDPRDFWPFWVSELAKVGLECGIGLLGGLVVVYKNVKVNYTRKIQHLFAYLLPMLFHLFIHVPPTTSSYKPVISAVWGYWFVLLAFLVVIYPIRTRFRVVFIMFSCLDRPEDRPHTLKWIVTQVVLGYVIIQTFTWYCLYFNRQDLNNLSFIFVLTTGVGDGLAEPVGIAFGTYKYRTRALCSSRSFTRSLQGSACVFLVCAICCAGFYHTWNNWLQFAVAMLTLPLAMTLAEAFSPHTWDTPFLMATGALLIVGITYIPAPQQDQEVLFALTVGLGGGVLVAGIMAIIIAVVVRKNLKQRAESLGARPSKLLTVATHPTVQG